MSEKTTAAKPAAKKPASRKPAAKRGPTKAAALKALGLTQEDLDVLKQVAQARELADKTIAQQEAKVATVEALEAQDEVVPRDLGAEVAAMKAPAPAPEPLAQTFFARNLRNADASIRLDRQDGRKKRLEFKPRGQRGDIQPLKQGDLEDPTLQANIGLLIEIITAAEAKKIIEKQVVNNQQQVHPAMAMLRNELGEQYAPDAIRVDAEFNSQGITVATLDPAQMQGRVDDKTVARGTPVQRIDPNQQHVPAGLGGNPAIISDGFAAQRADVSADAIARRKDLQGPAAGLGGVNVVVEPTQRT